MTKVGEDVFAHESTSFDAAVQGWVLGHQARWIDVIFVAVTTVGGMGPMLALAVLAALVLWRRGHRFVAARVLLAPAAAILLFTIVKNVYARPRPLGLGGSVPSSFSFPSGHATASTAVCCTLAYIWWRESLVRGPRALALAVFAPLLIGASRVYLNVHWTTDVLGGWSAGLFIAVLSAMLYDHYRRRRKAPREAIAPAPLIRF